MAAVEVVADRATRAYFPAALGLSQKLMDGMLERGLYTRAVMDCVCIAPPLMTSDTDLDRIVDIVGETIQDVVGRARGQGSAARD